MNMHAAAPTARIAEASDLELSPRRLRMLEAARELFIAEGYEKVSMDHVARAARVSKATLYAHFASKDALFATVVAEGCLANVLAMDFAEAAGDVRVALERFGDRVLRFLLQERTQAIYRVAVAEARRFPEMGRAFFDNGPGAFVEHFSVWLARQAEAGLLVVPDARLAAEQFGALVRSGLFLTCTLGLNPAPSDAQIAATVIAAVETFLRAYGPAPCSLSGRSPAAQAETLSAATLPSG